MDDIRCMVCGAPATNCMPDDSSKLFCWEHWQQHSTLPEVKNKLRYIKDAETRHKRAQDMTKLSIYDDHGSFKT